MTQLTEHPSPPAAAQASARQWIATELAEVDLGDRRLNRRLLDSAGKLAAQPTASINQACDDWAATKATYHLFAHDKVTPEAIRAPHLDRTQQRLRTQPLVLAVQDTTYLDYTAHPKTRGLGPLSRDNQPHLRGLVMHSTLACSTDGVPLGLLDQQVWARPEPAERPSAADRRRLPIEQKESFKWIQALRASVAAAPPAVPLVTVCDREADIYELLAEAQQLQTGLLVRAYVNRATADETDARLWQHVAEQPVVGQLQVEVPAQGTRPQRVALLNVRYHTLALRAPAHRPPSTEVGVPPTLTVSALLIEEVDAPPAETPLCWQLLTNCLVDGPSQALERVEWYCVRWGIEVYHKVVKSGCTVEACRLSSAPRLKRYLALMGVVAWRLFWLTHVNRTQPDAPCTTVLADHEWRALHVTLHPQQPLPTHPPTVRDAVRGIAQLGGFLGRTRDGEPGVTVIWRGWQRLQDLAHMYALLHPPNTYG